MLPERSARPQLADTRRARGSYVHQHAAGGSCARNLWLGHHEALCTTRRRRARLSRRPQFHAVPPCSSLTRPLPPLVAPPCPAAHDRGRRRRGRGGRNAGYRAGRQVQRQGHLPQVQGRLQL
eukprot:365988-Chlamydomonas_euryale.AAC.7